MTAIYRSYLIAHLSVPITPAPIDNLGQLLALRGATWGIEPGFGLGWDWFKLNTNAKVQDMFKKLEVRREGGGGGGRGRGSDGGRG